MIEQRSRSRWSHALAVTMLAVGSSGVTGCVTGEEFRAVAGPAVETGVTSIVNGLLDGLFAVIEPDATTGSEGG